jgi:hypothetical protein
VLRTKLSSHPGQDNLCHSRLHNRILAIDWTAATLPFQPALVPEYLGDVGDLRLDKFRFGAHISEFNAPPCAVGSSS